MITNNIYIYIYKQGVSIFHVHIFTTYGGMRTTLYGNFVLCKFKYCKKLQRFEFICEKTIFAVKSLFLQKYHENWLRGVIKCVIHSGVNKSSKN